MAQPSPDTSAASRAPAKAAARAPANPMRGRVLVVLGACFALLVYHLVADRFTPFTNQAYVQAFVVDIAPEVAGPVIEVNVTENRAVKAGEELFRIDPARFKIDVARAEAALAQAGQTIGGSTSQIVSAQARLTGALSTLDSIRQQSARTFELAAKGMASQASKDQATVAVLSAEQEAARARADLDAAKKQLGSRGADNPQLRTAAADLAKARLDLARSKVVAPGDGVVTQPQLSVGQYVAAGTPVMTFIDTRTAWMVAELREKSLGNVQAGNRAEIAFAGLPGRVYAARVESVGFGVSPGAGRSTAKGLPTINDEKDWLRPPQRFPVLLSAQAPVPAEAIRVGAVGTAVIYTGDHTVLNFIASLALRIVSLFGYIY
jgi:multidrug resistance efflux pump